ncbi:BTAD domain-containing putative transcriptional regulator [Nocardia sp. N2S4-5]|uniref:BTAD domain-containing putative transcriptional regulator n=1 Tax=Nocardia sp. N2S4-5 TaxID=3351565 RepID=UPI0037D8B7AE
MTGEHLFNERLHGHLMIALYRSGRRLEALEVFQRLRARMIDEVGLEPSKMLWHVHQAVLADSGLEYLSD